MDIANILTRLQRSGMTQKEIADEIPCSQSTVSEMLSGKVGTVRPSYKIVSGLMRLADKRLPRSASRKSVASRRFTDKSG